MQVDGVALGRRPERVDVGLGGRCVAERSPVGSPQVDGPVVAVVGRDALSAAQFGDDVGASVVGDAGHRSGVPAGVERGDRVVQRQPAAEGEQPAVGIEVGELPLPVGAQFGGAAGEPPAPGLRVEDRRRAEGGERGLGELVDFGAPADGGGVVCHRIPPDPGDLSRIRLVTIVAAGSERPALRVEGPDPDSGVVAPRVVPGERIRAERTRPPVRPRSRPGQVQRP
jgi:hypothetical protein